MSKHHVFSSNDVENIYIKYIFKGRVYSQIDKFKFIALLEFYELCKSCYSVYVEKHKKIIKDNERKIDKLLAEIREIQKKNIKLKKFEYEWKGKLLNDDNRLNI